MNNLPKVVTRDRTAEIRTRDLQSRKSSALITTPAGHSGTILYFPSNWHRGVVVSGVRRMNEVNARRARLVPGWVTVFGRVYHLVM